MVTGNECWYIVFVCPVSSQTLEFTVLPDIHISLLHVSAVILCVCLCVFSKICDYVLLLLELIKNYLLLIYDDTCVYQYTIHTVCGSLFCN